MIKTRRFLILTYLLPLLGCVSVQLGPKGPESAKNVSYEAPGAPFEKFTVLDVDGAWKNSRNGNSISYRTACNDPVEAEIQSMQQMLIDGLDFSKVEKSERIEYNGREALHSIVQGKLDGIATKIEMMIFKKNNCTYTITYVALPKNFVADQKTFQQFLKGFQAP